jgi:cardiolipin synthase
MKYDFRRWLFVFATMIFGGLNSSCTVISSVLGSEKRDVYKFEHPLALDSPVFRRSAEALGNPMVAGNSATLLKNGDEIFPAMTREIRQATRTVNLETYIFQPDAAGREFAAAMIAAARNGVEVRLLVDAWGSKLGDLEKPLNDAGVRVHVYRPVRLYSIYKVGKRTHRKILVVDGRIAYTGGLGIEEQWMGNARNSHEWRDTQVRVEGPVAAQMQAIFSEDWTYTTGEILAGDKFYPKIDPSGPMLAQAIKASRGDSSSLAKMAYYVAIKSATRYIHIANAYFLPDKQVRDSLAAAVKRGVDVEIMVPGRHIDLPLVRFASWMHYGKMLESGVQIYEYKHTMMHNKTMVVDGIYSTIGSINFDTRSMDRNEEESIAVYDRAFAEKMEEMFQEDKKNCKEITQDGWSRRGADKRAAELVSWIWEPYY